MSNPHDDFVELFSYTSIGGKIILVGISFLALLLLFALAVCDVMKRPFNKV